MKFTRLHLAALSLGLAMVGTTALPNQADAQRGQGGGGQGRGQGGFGGGMMGGRGMFGMADPLQSNANQLLQREDVQGELGISGAQKERMQTAQQQTQQTMRTKMQESGIDFQAMRDPNLDPAKRQEMMQTMRTKMQDVQKSVMVDQQKQVDTILTAPQRKRLAELDLQYRGPLALGDETVAKQFSVTPDQQREIGNILTEYRTGQQEAMKAMRPGGGQPGQPGGGQPGQFDPAEMQTRMAEARKSADRVKKTSGDKIVALLTDSQKSAWKAAQGKSFTFKEIAPQFGGGRRGGNGGGAGIP